jgi:hypothetical protein
MKPLEWQDGYESGAAGPQLKDGLSGSRGRDFHRLPIEVLDVLR